MTWNELDELVNNDLSAYNADQFDEVKDDLIEGDCGALQQAFEYVKCSMEMLVPGEDAEMVDTNRLAMIIQQLAHRTDGIYYWPFTLVKSF